MKFIQPVLALSGAGLAIAGGTLTIGGGPGPACSSATAAIPTCAIPCITSAAAEIGCAFTDFACECSPSAFSHISSLAAECVDIDCGVDIATEVEASASAACDACT